MYCTTKPNNAIIQEAIKKTWDTRWVKVTDGPAICRKFVLPVFEVDHTDGIGTKGTAHWQNRTFHNAVIDALAMNINDIYVMRAQPYKLQNHITLPVDDSEAIREIIFTMVNECKNRQIAITGGETSIHDNAEGLEISITMSGFFEQHYVNAFAINDILVGIASSGIHSNGFSLIRKLGIADSDLLTPTRIYDNIPNWPYRIHGLVHITGGGFTKIKPRLNGCNAAIHRNHSLKPQNIFTNIYKFHKINDEQMYKTFNCGIGFILAVEPKSVMDVISRTGGEVIGEVRKGDGKVIIESMFSEATCSL